MYGLLNVGSLALGLIAWILPIVNLVKRNKAEHKNWTVFSVASGIACAISLCLQILYQNHLVNIEDWSALMDTSSTVVKASSILLVWTIVLNSIAIAAYFKRRKSGEVEIIQGADGPTAVFSVSKDK